MDHTVHRDASSRRRETRWGCGIERVPLRHLTRPMGRLNPQPMNLRMAGSFMAVSIITDAKIQGTIGNCTRPGSPSSQTTRRASEDPLSPLGSTRARLRGTSKAELLSTTSQPPVRIFLLKVLDDHKRLSSALMTAGQSTS